jgi:hypothetical protein
MSLLFQGPCGAVACLSAIVGLEKTAQMFFVQHYKLTVVRHHPTSVEAKQAPSVASVGGTHSIETLFLTHHGLRAAYITLMDPQMGRCGIEPA